MSLQQASLRLETAYAALKNTLVFAFWIPISLLSLLLVYNTLPYFYEAATMPFVTERMVLYNKTVWKWSFLIHIAAGCICLTSVLIQFSTYILKSRKKIHILSGKIYVFVVIALGAPTGLYMSFFAKGNIDERICFVFMALFWFYTTVKGFQAAAIQRNFISHKFWMIRSYSMALTAVTFRVYHILFYLMNWSSFENYAISLWISVIGNMLVAELIIYSQSKNYIKTITQ